MLLWCILIIITDIPHFPHKTHIEIESIQNTKRRNDYPIKFIYSKQL